MSIALGAIVATALLSAAFSLVSIGRLAQRAAALAASGEGISARAMLAAFRPVDALLLALTLGSAAALVWLEGRHRALSLLLRDMNGKRCAILVIALIAWVGHSYWFPGVLLGGDTGSHVARFLEVRSAFASGEFPRWTNYDYLGSPLLAFTGPLTYLVGGALDLVVRNPVLTSKIFLFSLHLAGGLMFFALIRRFGLSRVAALIAAIGFSGSFAHLHLFLYRGVFPQGFTIFFLILLFYAVEGMMRRSRLNATDWLFAALATTGLIINHQPHALFAAFYLTLFGIASLVLGRWRWSALPALLGAAAAGAVASAFAVLPILAQADWVMIEPDNGFFALGLPSLARLSQLFLWHATRENYGTDYWAYLGLGLVALASLGLIAGLRGRLGPDTRKLVLAVAPCLVFLPFLSNPVVRDIIFILFFVAILTAVGTEYLARFATAPRLLLAALALLFLDVASTSIQPVARTDKQFLVDIGRYLQEAAPNERFMQIEFLRDQAPSPDIGPGAGPISALSMVQRISGTHNMAATRVHNYAATTVERAAGDLVRSGRLARAEQNLLSLFNVTRIICVNSFTPGCPPAFAGDREAPALGRYVAVADASPVLFTRALVALPPPPVLDKPMVWSERFRPETAQVRALGEFLSEYLARAQIEPETRLAAAIPVRQLPDGYRDPASAGAWHPALDFYRVEEQTVRLRLHADQPGYVQIAHPWYPGTRVLDNGQPVTALRGALDLIVLPLAPGEHVIELAAAATPIETISLIISLVSLLAIFMAFAALKRAERKGIEPRI